MTSQDEHEVSGQSQDVRQSNPWPKIIIAGTVGGTSAILAASLVFCILTCRRLVHNKRAARQRKLRRRLRSPSAVSTTHSTALTNSLRHPSSPPPLPGDISLPLPPDMTNRAGAMPAWCTQPTKLAFELPAASISQESRQFTSGGVQFDEDSSANSPVQHRLLRPTGVLHANTTTRPGTESPQCPVSLLFTEDSHLAEEGRRHKGLPRHVSDEASEVQGRRDDEWRYVRRLQGDTDDVQRLDIDSADRPADRHARLRTAVSASTAGSDNYSNLPYHEHNTWELTNQPQRILAAVRTGRHGRPVALTTDANDASGMSPEAELQEAEPVWIRRTSKNGTVLPVGKSAFGRPSGGVQQKMLSGSDADCKRLREQLRRSDIASGYEDISQPRVKHSARLWSTRS